MWSFIWRDVMVRLAGEFRCICIDAPGSGQSERLPKNEIKLRRSSHAVTEVIQQLALTDLVLVVHDLGGPAGIAGAAPAADRIRGIAAVNTFGWRPSGGAFRGMLALMGSAWFREA
jgi:pimeloyl-ACP methyl ester carboxylesterase